VILDNWTDEHTKKFQKDMFKVKHSLSKTGLFTDDALADLLDRHPKELLDVCTISDHPVFEYKFRTGDVRGVDGKTLIEAVKAGSIWMNLRKAMNVHDDYNKVLTEMYSELGKISGHKTYHANGGILISSPTAKVPFHFDATETILWHVRGHKRMYLYPDTEQFLSDKEYEKLMFSVSEDYLPYDESMEKAATCFDLYEDEMMTWPLNSPHRVQNMSYCVSVTTEYSTQKSSIKNAGMYANAFLRHKLGVNTSWRSASGPEKIAKATLGLALRKFGMLDNMEAIDMVSFKVDKNAPNFIQDIQPYQRSF